MRSPGFARVTPNLGINLDEETILAKLREGDADIEGTLVRGLVTEGLDAQSCAYRNVRFESCTFEHVDFSDSTFHDVEFRSCRFIACEMARSWLDRVDFVACSAPGLSFEKGRLTGVYVCDSQLSYANLSDCSIRQLRCRSTNLSDATFVGSRLLALDLADTDLTHASFHNAPLGNVDLSECRIAGIGLSSNLKEIRGAIIDETQAIDLMGYLGVRIKDMK